MLISETILNKIKTTLKYEIDIYPGMSMLMTNDFEIIHANKD